MVPLELIGTTTFSEEKKVEDEELNIIDEEEGLRGVSFQGIAWKNVYKTVNARNNESVVPLVQKCTGVVKTGELMAVMGLSGCGKTTLLRILSGRDHHGCSGTLLVGHYEVDLSSGRGQISSRTRRQIGYVAQEDIFLDTLTLREHLMFNAQLRETKQRNSRHYSYQDKVRQVIGDLHLSRCADNMIRWLSGGEKKRCSIATELLAEPNVIILDEATSGLDSAVAASLIHSLKCLAKGIHVHSADNINSSTQQSDSATNTKSKQDLSLQSNRKRLAIIMSIHQPSTGLFYSFDKLMLMVEGHTVYYGSVHEALSYFTRLGFEIPSTAGGDQSDSSHSDYDTNQQQQQQQQHGNTIAYNPADFIIELLYSTTPMDSRRYTRQSSSLSTPAAQRPEYDGWLPRYILIALYDAHYVDHEYTTFYAETSRVRSSRREEILHQRGESNEYNQRSICKELSILLRRTFLATSRTKALSWIGFLEVIFISALAGLTWFQTPLRESTVVRFSGFLFFNSAYWFFVGLFSGLLEFYPERFVIVKDYYAGAYRLSTYYLSRALGSIPIRVIFPTIFTIIANLLALHPSIYNNQYGVGIFLLTMLLLSLTVITGEAVGTFIGLLTTDLDRSISLGNITALSMLIFGGFYIKDIPIFLEWLKYISVLKYCFDALCQVRLRDSLRVPCDGAGSYIYLCYQQSAITGKQAREVLQVDEFPIGFNIAVMVLLYLIFRVAGYIALVVRVGK